MHKVSKIRIAVILTGSALSALVFSVGVSQAAAVKFLGPPINTGGGAARQGAAAAAPETIFSIAVSTTTATTAATTTVTTTVTITAITAATTTTATFLSPASGPVDTQATITGSGFTPTGNKVKFGNLGSELNPSYSLNSSDGRTLVFAVPSSNYAPCWYTQPRCLLPVKLTQPGIYPVSVINASGTSNEIDFTVIGSPTSSGEGTTTATTSIAPRVSTFLPANPSTFDIQSALSKVGQGIIDIRSGLNSPDASEQINKLRDQVTQIQQAIGGQASLQASTPQPSTPVAPQSAIPPSGSYTKSVSQGYRGDDVAALQQFLKTQGVDIYPEGLVTGYFGPLTKQAVQRLQLKYRIISNENDSGSGYVGPKTRARINSLLGL